MKKFISIFWVAAMEAGCLAGCGQKKSNEQSDSTDDGKIKVVTTTFPEYDWVKEIAGDKASNMDPTMLLDNGVDLHSYQPASDDILKISDCARFVYVGGESDGWVDDALKIATNKDMKVINLLDRKKFMMSMESPLFCMKRKSHLTMINLWHFWKMIIRKKLSLQKNMCGFMTMTYMYSFLNRLEEMLR